MYHQATTKSDLERMLSDESMEAKALPLSLLNCITNGFSDKNQIGRGGFAVVYKGLLKNGEEVAVKKLSRTLDIIDEEKFIGEVRCLMKAKHKNIVRFLGYCSDTQGEMVEYNGKYVMADVRLRLLCFEYLPNGSLAEFINDSSREWGKCYQIIKGVCEGLHYLHKERIVHSDLKPDNILLDNDMVPKITDFGISRCFDGNQTHVITENIIISLGYAAPEFFNGKISFKSDIYSLGVIIKEILTGEKGYPDVDKVLGCWRHKLEKSRGKQQLEQIKVFTEVCKSCLESDPVKRPCTQDIIDILQQTESKGAFGSLAGFPCLAYSTGKPLSHSHGSKKKSRQPKRPGLLAPHPNTPSASIYPQTRQGESLPSNQTSLKKRRTQVRQASPLVKNMDKSTWEAMQDLMKALEDRKDPTYIARTLKTVTQAIREMYAQGSTEMSTNDLYRVVYNLNFCNKAEVREELYSAVETTMASEVQSLCRPLLEAAPADGTTFLKQMLAKWNQHIKAVNFTHDILKCMEFFIHFHHKKHIKELGLHLWSDHMVRSDNIRERLLEAVRQQGGGEDELVAGVNKMLTDLGLDPCLFFGDTN